MPRSTKMETIVQVIGSTETLPPLPEVLAQIWQTANDPKTGARQLAEVIAKDPGLTADVLKVVNSGFFGMRREITSVVQAVTILGFTAIKNLSTSILIKNGLLPRRRSPGERFDRSEFWKHCVGVSIACGLIARKTGLLEDEAATAGLLHDAGIIVLDVSAPEHLGKIFDLTHEGRLLLEAEEEVLGCWHVDVGRALTDAWRFPQRLAQPILHHHDPLKAPPEHRRMACAVGLADALMASEDWPHETAGAVEADDPVLAEFRLTVAAAIDVQETARAQLLEASSLLMLPT